MADANKHPILLVDDEPEILYSLRGLLRREFDLHTAEGGAEALEILRRHPIHVIMSDQRMPGMTGVELLERARREFPEAIRIVFTGYADIKSVIDAINLAQVYRYVTKPWDPDELTALLHEACDHYNRIAQRRRLLLNLRDYLASPQAAPASDGMGVLECRALVERLDQALGDQSAGSL